MILLIVALWVATLLFWQTSAKNKAQGHRKVELVYIVIGWLSAFAALAFVWKVVYTVVIL